MSTNLSNLSEPGSGLTLEKIIRARKLLDEAPAHYETPDHIAARQATIDFIASKFETVKTKTILGSFYGLRIVADPSVALGCIEMRDKDGKVLAICGGVV